MARRLKSDPWLFIATLLLVGASLVMVYSASAPIALRNQKPDYYYAARQVMWALLGVAALAFVMRFDYRQLKQPVVLWGFLAFAVLGLLVVLLGTPVKGSRRWLGLGSFGVQPSEFAKLAMVFFTAAILEQRMDRINDVKYSLTPITLVLALVVGLVALEPDAGTAMAITAVVLLMVFAAGLSYRYLIGAASAIVPLAVLYILSAGYRRGRLIAYLDPWKDAQGGGFQLVQSMIAVGTGGVLGRGVGFGLQKLFYLPEPHNDFIYAVIAEELGLIGATAVTICFALITWRGLRIASRAPDAFAALVAVGLTTIIAVQAFVNMSVVLGLLPTKGISLPLVSAGGSSLVVNMVAIGILLNISHHVSAES